jgi:signal transduction histidine kinase
MGDININTNPSETEVIYKDLIRRARKEIMLLLPTEPAFLRQQKIGVVQMLVQLANEKGVKVRVLAPTVSTELQNEIVRLREQNVEVRSIKAPKEEEEAQEYRMIILTVDEQASIVIELNDDTKETFAEGIGISISTMNEVNVRSYVTLLRSYWQETELREKLFSKTIQLQKATESLGDMTRCLQATAKTLSVAEADLVVSEKKLASESENLRVSELALSDAQDALQTETDKLETSQYELAQSEKNVKMSREKLGDSELALLDSNQKMATMTEYLAIAIKNLAFLKKSSEAVWEGKDAQIKIADDLLFESHEKLAVTTRKLLEVNKEHVSAYTQIKINERLQRDFINIAAHELKTSLQPILGALDMLESGELDGKEGLVIIARNAKRSERLANDILNVARIENSSLSLRKEQFNKLIIDTDGKTLKISFGDMTHENLSVYADKEKISGVIYNLVTNAINHNGRGEILLTLMRQDNNIVFKVIDSGFGIREDVKKKLFSKFMTTSPKGMGLALYISKNVIEAHGGKIWAENNANCRGATFGFSIPMNRVEKNDH